MLLYLMNSPNMAEKVYIFLVKIINILHTEDIWSKSYKTWDHVPFRFV
jgi:hypothetical protein